MRVLLIVLLTTFILMSLGVVRVDVQTDATTEQAVQTLSFTTTFDPWPVEGLTRENVTLQVVGEDLKPLATFPVSREGAVTVDLRSLRPGTLRPIRANKSGQGTCGIEVSAYTPTDLAYASATFRLVDKNAARDVGFGQPYDGLVFKNVSTTVALLFTNGPGSLEGTFLCEDQEFQAPAKLSLNRGVNYLKLEALKVPLVPAQPELVATRKLAYNDPFAFPEPSE